MGPLREMLKLMEVGVDLQGVTPRLHHILFRVGLIDDIEDGFAQSSFPGVGKPERPISGNRKCSRNHRRYVLLAMCDRLTPGGRVNGLFGVMSVMVWKTTA